MRNGITATGSVGAKPVRVLVVDDEFSLRRTLTIGLRAAEYQVTSAANGAEALERLRLTTFDVVIADLMMPDITGIELLRVIQRRSPETAVIFLAADFDPQLATDAVARGAFGCVQQVPGRMISELTEKVEQALNHFRHKMGDENRNYSALTPAPSPTLRERGEVAVAPLSRSVGEGAGVRVA